MSQELGLTATTSASASLPWWEVWIIALARPSVETFESLVRDPNASTSKAYTWVFITGLIGSAISMLAQLLLPGASTLSSVEESEMGAAFGSSLVTLICLVPLSALFSVLGLMIRAGITQLIARALGGTGTYSRLVYAFAAFVAPLTVIFSILGSIPYVSCLVFPLTIYACVLPVIAVKAVNQFGWGRAIVSGVVILAGILLLVAVIFILALLGPVVGGVFSNIMQEIATPVP